MLGLNKSYSLKYTQRILYIYLWHAILSSHFYPTVKNNIQYVRMYIVSILICYHYFSDRPGADLMAYKPYEC